MVLEKELNADWASSASGKSGARDSKTFSREVRGEYSDRATITFSLSEDEIPRSYLLVEYFLPPTKGIATFGSYYLPLSQTVSLSKHSLELTSGAVR